MSLSKLENMVKLALIVLLLVPAAVLCITFVVIVVALR